MGSPNRSSWLQQPLQLALVFAWFFTFIAYGQEDEKTDDPGEFEHVKPPPGFVKKKPDDEDEKDESGKPIVPDIDTGSPLAKVVENVASAPDRLRNLQMGADIFPSFLTRKERGHALQANLIPSLAVPFFERGKVPENAEIKIGRFYVDFADINLSALHSDNVDREEKDGKSDTIASVSLGTNIYFELTDDSYFALSGAFVWLPLEGDFGVDGLGLRDIFSLGVKTLFDAEMFTDMRLGGWDVVLQDLLVVRDNSLEAQYSKELAIFDGEDFTNEDTAGRYSFGDETKGQIDFSRDTRDVTSDKKMEIVNTASVASEKPVAEETFLRLGAFHKNIWYPRDSGAGNTLVTEQTGLNAGVFAERKDWRFNPFITYSQTRNNRYRHWLYIGRVGAEGPLTDQIHLHADVGRAWGGENNIGGATLWRFGYNHILGSSSRTTVECERQVSDYGRAIETRFLHTFDQIFGPRLRGRAFWGWSEFDEATPFPDYRMDYYGGTMFLQILPRLGNVNTAYFTRSDYLDSSRYVDLDVYESKLVLVLSPKSYLECGYEHRFRQANSDGNYRENIFRLTYSKWF